MRRTLLIAWITCLSLAAHAQSEPRGLVVYQETAASTPETWEYRSFRKDNALYSTVITATGERKQLKTAGVAGTLDYPPYSFDDSFPDVAQATLGKIRTLERQFPQLQHQLNNTRGKWERALSVYNQTNKTKDAAAQTGHILRTFDVKGSQYANVRLVSATYDSATISHDAGVAKIPIRDLAVSQIVSLNTTSATAQLGTTAFADAQVASSQPALGNKINATGARALMFIAARTGFRYDTVHGWLLFVIFPALIVALLVVNVTQARRLKTAPVPKRRPIRPPH